MRTDDTVDVVVYDGVDELDAVGPFEIFANARLDVALVSLDGARTVTGSHGLRLLAVGQPRDAPTLLVPGGGWNTRAEEGARAQARRGVLPAAVARAHARGATIAAVCTGALLLAEAGLLRGRPAVTHHGAIAELATHGVHVLPDARVVDDGDIITCGGVTAGLDLALHLVQRLCGPDVANRVAREMEHERRDAVLPRTRTP